ncbi:MAG: hypothetical protein IPK50_19000 [Fibrobacterota bacterium]|nr:MAG: hypothetical protein IPK50_19000 [Fibrobacterota bacterium]
MDLLDYQAAVPAVDVSAEIFNQWDDCFHVGWNEFDREFSEQELASLNCFAQVLGEVAADIPQHLPPIDRFLESTSWKRLQASARRTLMEISHVPIGIEVIMADASPLLDRICDGLRCFGLDVSRTVLVATPDMFSFLEGARIRILHPEAFRQGDALELIQRCTHDGRPWVNFQYFGRIEVGELILVEWSPQVGAARTAFNFSGPFSPVVLMGGDASRHVESDSLRFHGTGQNDQGDQFL